MQCVQSAAGAATEIENTCGLQGGEFEPFQQAFPHLMLQHRGCIVAAGSTIEGGAHQMAIEPEIIPGVIFRHYLSMLRV